MKEEQVKAIMAAIIMAGIWANPEVDLSVNSMREQATEDAEHLYKKFS